MKDPIHEDNGKWYFWNETWSDRIGPFDTEDDARDKLDEYCDRVLGYEVRDGIEIVKKFCGEEEVDN